MIFKFFEFTDPGVGVWHLPVLGRLFLLLLFMVGTYSLYSNCVILVGLRSLSRRRSVGENNSFRHSLILLKHRAAHLRELILATLCLFGLTFFLQITAAFVTPIAGPYGWVNISQNLAVQFSFAADIFLVLFVLQVVQWFTSTRVRSMALELGPETAE